MKKFSAKPKTILLLSFFLLAAALFMVHPGKHHDSLMETEEEGGTEAFNEIEARNAYEFNMLKNPGTGTIPDGVFEQERKQADQIRMRQRTLKQAGVNTYAFQGPNNMGGRTRSVVYDVRFNGTNQTILAGGVSGGIFKSTDNGANWTRKSPNNQLYSVTSIAQDPRTGFQDTWYYATGEAIGNSAGATGALYLGNGIYKSTDNGESWTRLANSNTSSLESFNARQDLISKVIVDPNSGDIYFAAIDGIYRSQDGGTSWANVLTSGGGANSSMVTDIVCTTTSPTRFYASFSGTNTDLPNNMPGVWTSTTGASGSWTKIAGATAATDPAGWNANGTYRRVVLAIPPSNQNLLYALYDNGLSYPSAEAKFYKWDLNANTWTNLSANLPDEPGGSSGNDPFAVQAGYDMVIAIKPDDANAVFIGGTNIYRSTDGFATNTNYTRIGGYANPNNYSVYTNSHPDIHAIAFQPNNTAVMICGNDGGIQRTSDDLAATVAWANIAAGYRTYQYYYVALDPQSGNTKVIGGAQDNGTTRNYGGAGTDFESVIGGDGVSVGLSNPVGGIAYEYGGSQNGAIYRRDAASLPSFVTSIRPTAATDNGLFVTLFKLDNDNTEYLYYASDSSLYRNTTASTATPSDWTQMTGVQNTIVDGAAPKTVITALTTTRGSYNPSTASLFIGTNEGRLYRLDDPVYSIATTTPVNITGAGFPAGGYISSIAVNPRNDDTLLVTFSNYGVTSVFWTGNANSASPTWQNVEGNLTLPSFRSSAIVLDRGVPQYLVGTSVGLYKTTIDGASPGTTSWLQEGPSDIGNAVVTSLAYRSSDGRLLAGTHGYGMWATNFSQVPLPVSFLGLDGRVENSIAILQWATGFEQDVTGFDIEKSVNGTDFVSIGNTKAAGNSTHREEYSYRDPALSGKAYYRIRIKEASGSSKTSNVVLLTNNVTTQQVSVSNPFVQRIDLRLGKQASRVSLQLLSANGAVLAEQRLSNPALEIHWQLPRSLGSGTYFLRSVIDGQSFTDKLIRQ